MPGQPRGGALAGAARDGRPAPLALKQPQRDGRYRMFSSTQVQFLLYLPTCQGVLGQDAELHNAPSGQKSVVCAD
ncbi:hypothetical protein OJAV_G00122930 [Oryzias javanicus]|uniref:Uncharacterized protein n=1 Tax=Oryzias javanicus TaxID=123683 RepID=A0A3S2M1P3_ORYJA|nr:hypothetical protein OJAV_G00122930 [Oryzias javanicus]